jgi:dihydroorotase
VRQNRFKLPFVVDLMTRRPARLMNLPGGTLAVGSPADICLFDPAEKWLYEAKAASANRATHLVRANPHGPREEHNR